MDKVINDEGLECSSCNKVAGFYIELSPEIFLCDDCICEAMEKMDGE